MYWRMKREMKKAIEAIAIKPYLPPEPHAARPLRSLRIALVVCLLILLTTASVLAVRFIRMDVEVGEDKISLFQGYGAEDVDWSEDEAYRHISDSLRRTVLQPSSLPAGMRIGGKISYAEGMYLIAYHSGSAQLSYKIQKSAIDELSGMMVDTEGGKAERLRVGNWDVTLCRSIRDDGSGEQWYITKWSDADLLYSVQTNLSRNEVIRFIQNLNYTGGTPDA